MNLKETKYDAFISYRHSELDIFVAETLRRQLEGFRVPRQIVREKKMKKTKIERVFRDRDELPLASNLAEPIMAALSNAEYLIVICTPRLPESQWCKKEIETFIEKHGRERVFAVLAEGEPSESFPQQLLFEEVEEINEWGQKVTVRRMIEPLAADVRGKDKAEIKKKMKEEILRLTAPMFELNYDDLKQRHREQKVKRVLATAAGICGIFLAFGISSGILALQINSQSKQIAKQNAEITAQSVELEAQYNTVKMNYGKTMADKSKEILNYGDRMGALYVARSVLPSKLETPETPYVGEAHMALTQALGVYNSTNARRALESYGVTLDYNGFQLSAEGTKLLAIDSVDCLNVWDTVTHLKVLEVPGCSMAHFLGEDRVFYSVKNEDLGSTTYLYSLKTKEIEEMGISYKDDYCSKDGSLLTTTLDGENVVIWDVGANKALCEIDVSEYELPAVWDVCYSEDNTKAIVVVRDVLSGSKPADEKLVSIPDGTVIAERQFDTTPKKITYFNGHFYHLANYFTGDSLLETEGKALIECLDENDLSVLWSTLIEDTSLLDIDATQGEDGEDIIYGNSAFELFRFDVNTGEVLLKSVMGVSTAYIFPKGNGALLVLSYDGDLYTYSWELDALIKSDVFIKTREEKFKSVVFNNDDFYIALVGQNRIVRYGFREEKNNKFLAEFPKGLSLDGANRAGTRFLQKDGEVIFLYDANGEVIRSIPCDIYARCVFAGEDDETIAIGETNRIAFYSAENGTYISENKLKEDTYFGGFSADQSYYTVYTFDAGGCEYRAFSTKNGELIGQTPAPEIETCYGNIVFSGKADTIACIDGNFNEIRLYHNQENTPYLTKSIKLESKTIDLSDDGKFLLLTYGNGNIAIYDTADMTLKAAINDMDNMDITMIYEESIQSYIVANYYGAYLLNSDLQIYGYVEAYEAFDPDSMSFIQNSHGSLYRVPYYTYEELIQMADKRLEGYTMSEEDKLVYRVEQ